MASEKPLPLSRAELEAHLNVYRICFEAALTACPTVTVTAVEQNPHNPLQWQLEVDEYTVGGKTADFPLSLVDAHRKWYLCDHFCYFVLRSLRQHLESKYGATVKWCAVSARPELVLVKKYDSPDSANTHSILVVETQEGEGWVFDCTGEQFGWPKSEWLMELSLFVSLRMTDGWDIAETYTQATEEIIEQRLVEQDDGYWAEIVICFGAMWKDFEWDALENSEAASVESLVFETAKEMAEVAALATWNSES
ncbi:hypothetical protein ACEQ8H_008598 [Pleosporales sp. CAS-2024a]